MKKLILFISVTVMLTVSCSKLTTTNEGNDQLTEMDDLIIDDDFNFRSTKTVDLNITLPFTVDFSSINSRIAVYDKSPDEGGVLIYTGSADHSGQFYKEITVPSYITEVYVSTMAGDEILSITETTKSGSHLKSFSFNFGADYGIGAPRDTIPGTESQVIVQEITDASFIYSEKASTQDLISNGTFDIDDFGSQQNWSSAMTVDGKWYITSQFSGSAGQYNDGGENVLRIQRSGYSGGVAQLIDASAGDLITATAKYKVSGSSYKRGWLYLIARNANGASIAYYYKQINSSSTNWKTYTVAATMPPNTVSVQVLLWQHIYGGEIFWDDVTATGPVSDSDGDGVNDEEDDYPNDGTKAYNIYYPNDTDFASLAFEDNWPGKGDYDFNDLVVDYQFKQIANSDNELVELESKFKIRAVGASLTNGFGFEMGLASSDIANVSGHSIVDNYITLAGNNAEANQSKGTIIVTDNAFTQLVHPGGGTGVNTTPGQTYVQPTTMTILTTLTTPVALSVAGSPPYNPFMIVDQTRGREVHLPNSEPTSLADDSYFGTQHDDSNIASGKYYKTQFNLPWAIDIPSSFDYPVEKALVISAYLHFAEWAESSGSQFDNWYLDNSGYRNDGNIFQVPN